MDEEKKYSIADQISPPRDENQQLPNVSENTTQNTQNNLEGKLLKNTPVRESQIGMIFRAFLASNFFRPIAVIFFVTIFLGGLFFYVFKNIGTVGGGGEVVWWGVSYDESVYTPLIAEFEKQNPNIKIKYEKQSKNDYRERLNTSLSSGKGPDIFEIHNTWPYMFKSHLDKLPGSIWSSGDYQKSFLPVVFSNFNFGGGIVAIPLEFDAITLFINEDIFASSAKKPPVSWDELSVLAGSMTQKDSKGLIVQSGVSLGNAKNIDYWPDIIGLMMMQNRVNPIKPSGSFAQDVMTFYTMFGRSSWSDSLPPSTEAFAKGKVAMYFGPTREAFNIVKINPNIRFKTVGLPQLAKNTPKDPDYSYATYWAHSVWNKSKKSQAAWQFLKFMASEDSLRKVNNNIKKSETFGRVFPRPSMNEELREDSLLGSVVVLSGSATSSLLADKTNDGATGLNSKISKMYKEIVDGWKDKGRVQTIDILAKNLTQVLSEYGISVK